VAEKKAAKPTAKKKPAKKMGRPTVMTAEMVKKLEFGFLKGLTDEQCCLFAVISKQALYDYCHAHPEFTDRKELLKQQPSVQAKINIAEGIENGDADLSKWYLERKNKDEFSTKQDIGVSGSVNNPFDGLTTDELKKLIVDD
jgi:hypothetical protein